MKRALFLTVLSIGWVQIGALEKLASIAGLWKMQIPGGALYEEWRLNEEGVLVGTSYKVSGRDTAYLEKVRVQTIDTTLHYIANVFGQNAGRAVPFKLISYTNDSFVFENKQHDYPGRVVYRIVNSDSMTARIEGIEKGKAKHFDFFYRKVK